MKTENSIDIVYQMVTEKFVAALEAGVAPWQKPWSLAGRLGTTITSEPRNIASRRAYRGINVLLLGFLSNFESRYWGTFNQIKELGGHVKAGSQSSLVVFFRKVEKKDKNGAPVIDPVTGRPVVFPMIRYSRVFNLTQTEGITDPDAEAIAKAKAEAAKKVKKVKVKKDPAIARAEAVKPLCEVQHGGDRACYSVALDSVRMPAKESFASEANYHHTLFHEFAHASGHSTRLNRESLTASTAFGSEVYSKEELVAEITASFVGSHVGIMNEVIFNNSAAYLGSWLKKLKDDPKLIVSAASAAQRAADLILGISPEAPVES